MVFTTVIPNACHVDRIAVTALGHPSRSLDRLCRNIFLLRMLFQA